jgi:hypothetical protein
MGSSSRTRHAPGTLPFVDGAFGPKIAELRRTRFGWQLIRNYVLGRRHLVPTATRLRNGVQGRRNRQGDRALHFHWRDRRRRAARRFGPGQGGQPVWNGLHRWQDRMRERWFRLRNRVQDHSLIKGQISRFEMIGVKNPLFDAFVVGSIQSADTIKAE